MFGKWKKRICPQCGGVMVEDDGDMCAVCKGRGIVVERKQSQRQPTRREQRKQKRQTERREW